MCFPQIEPFAWRVSLVPKVMGKSSGASANDTMLYGQVQCQFRYTLQ